MKLSHSVCIVAVFAGLGFCSARGQTSASGQSVSVPTPTPPPTGTASTALNSSLTGGGVVNGQGTMGTGVGTHAIGASAVAPIVPGAVTINSNGSSVGTGNVAGSVQINNGGPGSVTGAPGPVSPIPTYVTPGTGLGTPITGITTAPNPNPGSVQ